MSMPRGGCWRGNRAMRTADPLANRAAAAIGAHGRPSPRRHPLGLTFDDVLLQPLESSVLPSGADTAHLPDPRDPAQHSDAVVGDGHGDRGRHGDRDGAAGRDRRAPPQFHRRRAGRRGARGQALRERDGGQSDHHDPRPDAGRSVRTDEATGSAAFRSSRSRASSPASSPTATSASPRIRTSRSAS